jgi:hypothetical protein
MNTKFATKKIAHNLPQKELCSRQMREKIMRGEGKNRGVTMICRLAAVMLCRK